jgi:hypothetical protein
LKRVESPLNTIILSIEAIVHVMPQGLDLLPKPVDSISEPVKPIIVPVGSCLLHAEQA